MIQPDAKCVVNGPKVNEVINALNQLLNIDITIGDVNEPQVQYGYDGVQIVLPKGGAFTNEELDVVDSNNTASTRWFATSTTQGMTPVNTNTSPVNKQNTSTPTGRDNINGGTGTSGALRDEMPLAPNQPNNQGGGVNPPGIDGGGGALKDDGTTTRGGTSFTPGTGRTGTTGGGQTDEFGNVIGGTGGALLDDGTTTRGVPLVPTGDTTSGALLDDGTTTRDTTPPPRVGAPPLEDTTPPPLVDAPPITGEETIAPTAEQADGYTPASQEFLDWKSKEVERLRKQWKVLEQRWIAAAHRGEPKEVWLPMRMKANKKMREIERVRVL